MIDKEQLLGDGFVLLPYPDGNFWLLRAHEDLFLQVDEALTNITIFDNGWVDDGLSREEYNKAVAQFKNKEWES